MRHLAIVALMAVNGSAWAANSNQSINVQGVLRDTAGQLQSMPVSLFVKVYDSQAAMSPFHTESFNSVAVENGFFSVELSGDDLNFSTPDAWIGIQVGGDSIELPRQHLTSVPYAISALVAATAAQADALSPKCAGCVK